MVRFLAGLLAVIAWAWPSSALADVVDLRALAEETYDRAAKDDEALHFASALSGYEESIAILPSHRYAQRAATRIDFLRGHSEGGFGPLVALEAVRRTPGATKDAAKVDALMSAARGFPPGAVRGEAFFVCGEAYLTELHRPADAESALRATLDEGAASPLLRKQAAARLVDLALAKGDLADASALADRADDPVLSKRVAVARRRGKLHLASIGALAIFAIGATVATARKRRAGAVRPFLPWAFALVAYVGGVGGLLASAYESGNALPFVAFGALLLPLLLLARAWGVSSNGGAIARAARALVSATAVLAAAFLLLERIDPRYLDGFGL